MAKHFKGLRELTRKNRVAKITKVLSKQSPLTLKEISKKTSITVPILKNIFYLGKDKALFKKEYQIGVTGYFSLVNKNTLTDKDKLLRNFIIGKKNE